MRKKADEIKFNVILYGWAGELLAGDGPGRPHGLSAPKGSLLWDFLTQWIQKNPNLKDHFFDSDKKAFKSDMLVILNGKHLRWNEKVEIRQGDSIALIRVAIGG